MMKLPACSNQPGGTTTVYSGRLSPDPTTSAACVPGVSGATPVLNVGAGVDSGLGVDAGWVVGVGEVVAR